MTQLLNKRTGTFGADDEATLDALTQQLGVALDNARLFDRSSTLHSYISTLQAHEEFPATLRRITATAASLLACSHVVIYIHDRRTGQLASRFTDGISDFSIHQDCGAAGAVYLSGEIMQVDDPARSTVWSPEMDLRTGFKTRALLTAPLRVPGSDAILGAVEGLNKYVGKFHAEDHTLLQVFAALTGLVLQGWHTSEVKKALSTRYDAQQQLCAKLSNTSELPSIARELTALRGPNLLNCAAFSLIVIEGDELVIKDDDFRTMRRIPSSHGISGAVAVDGEPLSLDDALADDRYEPQVDCVPGLQTRSMLVVPVKASTPSKATGRYGTVALLQAVNKLDAHEEPYSLPKTARFDETDLALLKHIATLITSAHKHATTDARHSLELSRAKTLFDLGQEITATTTSEIKPTMQTVRKRVSKLFDCERASLFVVDEETLHGLSAEDDATEMHFPVRTGLTGRVANLGEKINLKDQAYQDSQFKPEIDWQAGYRVRSFLCMPLVKRTSDGHHGKTPIGVVQLVNKHSRDGFTEADEHTLSKLCGMLYVAVVNYKNLRATQLKLKEAEKVHKRTRAALLWERAIDSARKAKAAAEAAKIMKDGQLVTVGSAKATAPGEEAPAAVEGTAPAPTPAAAKMPEQPKLTIQTSTESAGSAQPSPGPNSRGGSFKSARRSSLPDTRMATIEGGIDEGDEIGPPSSRGRAASIHPRGKTGSGRLAREGSSGRMSQDSMGISRGDSGIGGGRDRRQSHGDMLASRTGKPEDLGNNHPLSTASTISAFRNMRPDVAGRLGRALMDTDIPAILSLQDKVHSVAPLLYGIAREAKEAQPGKNTGTAVSALIKATQSGGTVAAVQRKRMHALLELAQAVLAHEGDEEGLLLAASKCALGMGSAHGCRIFVLEEGVLWTADAQRKRLQFPLNEAGLTGHVLQSGTALSIDRDASDHDKFARGIDWDLSGAPSSLLVAPIKDGSGEIAGMLTAGRRNEGGFTIEERSLLEMAGRTSSHSSHRHNLSRGRGRRARLRRRYLTLLARYRQGWRLKRSCRRSRRTHEHCSTAGAAESTYAAQRSVRSILLERVREAAPQTLVRSSLSSRGLQPMKWGNGIVGRIAKGTVEFVSVQKPSEEADFDPEVDGEVDESRNAGADKNSPVIASGRRGSMDGISPLLGRQLGGGLLGAAVHNQDGKVAGVILVLDKLQGQFNAADEVLLRHVSDLVSKELKRNSNLATLRRAQAQSDNLVLASEMLHLPVEQQQDATSLLAKLNREVVWRCQQLSGADVCAIYDFNAEDNVLTLAEHTRKGEKEGGSGDDAESLLLSKIPITVKLGRGLVGAASASGQQRLIEDPTSCPEFDAVVDNPLQLSELRSMALTPCSTSQGQGDDKVSGGTSVLVLYNKLRQNASSSGATKGPRSVLTYSMKRTAGCLRCTAASSPRFVRILRRCVNSNRSSRRPVQSSTWR